MIKLVFYLIRPLGLGISSPQSHDVLPIHIFFPT
ncbi:hypothetical protein YPC_0990 [Yersinia pestis biovar Medievalis str. Harbin 35]|nr:hypothetical protein YPC_0990 [Yersinia pestis biovar Medievalis str. Harbin 35]